MAIVMKTLNPVLRGRVRTSVGHKYLEALQENDNATSPCDAHPPALIAGPKPPGLDLLILGVTSGTAMDDIDFALCRFTQESPEAALYLDVVKVRLDHGF